MDGAGSETPRGPATVTTPPSRGTDNYQRVNAVLTFLTLCATAVAAIPAFFSIVEDKPDIYFSSSNIPAINESFPNSSEMRAALLDKKLPDAMFTLELQNTGNAPAQAINVSVKVDGTITKIVTVPSVEDQPVWIKLPDKYEMHRFDAGASFELKDLASKRGLKVHVFYVTPPTPGVPPKEEVLFNGKPAVKIGNINEAPEPTLLRTFRTPLTVLGVGLFMTAMVALLLALIFRLETIKRIGQLVRNVFLPRRADSHGGQ